MANNRSHQGVQPHLRQPAIASLTDNSGGTASGTLAAISDTATKNAIASVAAKQEAILDALRAAGLIDE